MCNVASILLKIFNPLIVLHILMPKLKTKSPKVKYDSLMYVAIFWKDTSNT